MHVCILGTGAAGWLSAWHAHHQTPITQVTIIGSPDIPTIGVGESTTNRFPMHLKDWFQGEDLTRFLVDIDAAVKYGVYYENWGTNDFLHAFTGHRSRNRSSYLLGSLPPEVDPMDYISVGHREILQNRLSGLQDSGHAWHFDANRFIAAMQDRSHKLERLTHIRDTVVSAQRQDDKIQAVVLSDGTKITADYFISCIGQTAFNQRLFGETYVSYADKLLTDRAVFCPLPYQDRHREFHPYTVARTLRHGWRWITPTWSRIGTGYVFSSRHISSEQARRELAEDIGDDSLEFFEADFFPRRIATTFGSNYCFNGMAGGFLEPLDAPGLSMTLGNLERLKNLIYPDINDTTQRDLANRSIAGEFDFWCSFILHQYKTCYRRDSDFWIDQSSVHDPYYQGLIENMFDPLVTEQGDIDFNKDPRFPAPEPWMFFHTTLGRGHRWPVRAAEHPTVIDPCEDRQFPHHYDVFHAMHRLYEDSR